MTLLRLVAPAALGAAAALAAACGGARTSATQRTAGAEPGVASDSGRPLMALPGPSPQAVARPGTWDLGAAACPAPANAARATGQSVRDTTAASRDSVGPRAGARAGATRGVGDAQPDVVVLASASVRELRFNSQPDVRVRLCGGGDSVRVLERRNLPERVVPGTTYRDVYVAVEILGHVDVGCTDTTARADTAGVRARVGATCLRFTLSDSARARRRSP